MRLRPSSGRDGSSCCAWQALNAALGPPPDISSRQCASAGYPRRRPAAVSLPTVVATNYEDATPVATNSAGDWPRILHAHITWWRRGESNPRPKSLTVESLHAYRVHLPLSPAALWNAQERTAGQPDPVARISPGTLRRQVPSQPAG